MERHQRRNRVDYRRSLRSRRWIAGGREREIVYWEPEENDDLSESDRDAEPRSASGELQRSGRIQRYADNRRKL